MEKCQKAWRLGIYGLLASRFAQNSRLFSNSVAFHQYVHPSSLSMSSLPLRPPFLSPGNVFLPFKVAPFVPLFSCRSFISRIATLCASPTLSPKTNTSSFSTGYSPSCLPNAASILCHISTSYCVTKEIAFPAFPARAVRPTRWMYVLLSGGRSRLRTTSTEGMSRPRAATSVATSILRLPALNFPSAPRRED